MATIWCVGRNYRDHAIELGNPVPQRPLIFLKSQGCLTTSPEVMLSQVDEVHYEGEIALLLNTQLEVEAVTVALDLTDRTRQTEAKLKGEPWSLAKSFKNACPIGPWIPISDLADLQPTDEIQLQLNRTLRQRAPVSQMIFSPTIVLDYLKKHFPVQPQDIVLLGTPSGVGPLANGDRVDLSLTGKIAASWTINIT